MKKNILVGQSGNPIAAINAGLYGIIIEGMARPKEVDHICSMVNDIEGFLSDYVTSLSLLTREDLSLLRQTPVAYLGPCRLRLPENLDAPVYSLLSKRLTAMSIGTCFYIGGGDSMDTVDKLSRCVRTRREIISFMGIPKTIDNDSLITDHTPGYGSAAKYVASTVRGVSLDASVCQQPAVTIVELMGRHTGWVITAGTLARKYPGDNPLLVCIPEVPLSMGQLFKDVEQVLSRQPNMVVCISEGIHDKKGRFICKYTSDARVDTFGHEVPTDYTKILEGYVHNRFYVKVRSIELNANQRCNSLLAFAADVEETECPDGRVAEKALREEIGKMVTCSRLSGPGYELEYGLTEVSDVYNHEKSFPVEQVAAKDSDIGSGFLDCTFPLVQGQSDYVMENELSKYLYRKQPP